MRTIIAGSRTCTSITTIFNAIAQLEEIEAILQHSLDVELE